MNFEIIDNLFQVSVLFCGMIGAVIAAIKYENRRFVILALAYISFAMGTFFWVMHILIRGDVPRVFCVPEVSWLASYTFCLSLQIVRMEKIKVRFCAVSTICGWLIATEILRYHILGPWFFMVIVYAITMATLVYRTVFRLRHYTLASPVDWGILVCAVLQVLLYIVSARMEDFTKFNLYYVVDIMLSVSYVMLLPLQIREVKKNDLC